MGANYYHSFQTMATKVLVNTIGQHIVADTKQVEEKETKAIIAYLVENPRVASYSRDDDGNVNVGFAPYCVLSDEFQFTIRAENIVSILEPRDDVKDQYEKLVGVGTDVDVLNGVKPAEEEAESEAVEEKEPVAAE